MLQRQSTESIEPDTRKLAPPADGSTASPTMPKLAAGRSVREGVAPLSGFLHGAGSACERKCSPEIRTKS